ncbi:hypothetical protein E3Q19_01981 [Wallemia mellicola]|nr:hypothetical protein E3Q19_01981 [Wallemia mellicola]
MPIDHISHIHSGLHIPEENTDHVEQTRQKRGKGWPERITIAAETQVLEGPFDDPFHKKSRQYRQSIIGDEAFKLPNLQQVAYIYGVDRQDYCDLRTRMRRLVDKNISTGVIKPTEEDGNYQPSGIWDTIRAQMLLELAQDSRNRIICNRLPWLYNQIWYGVLKSQCSKPGRAPKGTGKMPKTPLVAVLNKQVTSREKPIIFGGLSKNSKKLIRSPSPIAVADYIGLSNPKKRKADSMAVRYTSRNDYDESDDLDSE